MIFYLTGLHPFFLYAIIFSVISIFTIACLFTIHKLFKQEITLMEGDRFIVPFYTISAAVLGFILAMVLVETWKNYQDEKKNITNEISNLIGIYRLSNGLEPSDSDKIKNTVKELVKEIVEVSWPAMEKGEASSIASKTVNKLYLNTLNLKVKDDFQKDIRKDLIDHLEKATDLRRHRFLRASESIVPDSMWPVIILCIFTSLTCSFFFNIKPLKLHLILSLFQCAMISFVLFLIFSLMYPYRGSMKIEPKSFVRLLEKTFKDIDQVKTF